MKRIIFTIFMLTPLTSICQSIDTMRVNSNLINKIYIGLSFSPDYCYRTIKTDFSTIYSFEIPKFGFTTGLSLIYILNNKFNLETGLLFSDKGQKIKKNLLELFTRQEQTNDPVFASGDGQNDSVSRTKFSYQYLDIPLKINYYITNKKLKFFVSTGLSANIFITYKETTIVEFSDGRKEKSTYRSGSYNKNFSKVNFALLAGFGIDYDLNNKIRFRLEPIYRRSIHSIIDAPIKRYLYSAGVNAGIYYKL